MICHDEATKSGQLKKQLIRLIADGTLPIGSRLPSERMLEQQFGISRVSVRKALEGLLEQGYLSRESGCRPVIASSRSKDMPPQIELAFVTNLEHDALFDIYRLCYEEFLQCCNRSGIRLSYVDISQPLPAYLGAIDFRAIFVAGDFRMANWLDTLTPLRRENTRIFLLDSWSDCPEFSVISTNNVQGGAMAAKLLVENGCKKLLLIGRRSGYHYAPFVDRRTGFINELHKRGTSCHVFDVGLKGQELQLEPLREYLESHPDTDGIFTISDALGVEVIHLLNKMGRRVPEEIQVLGFDGLSCGELARPRLSSIAQPVRTVVDTAIRLALSEKNDTIEYHIPCTLLRRDSIL